MLRFSVVALATLVLVGSGNATPFESVEPMAYTLHVDRPALASVGPLLFGAGGKDGNVVLDEIIAIHPDLAPGKTVLGHLPTARWGASAGAFGTKVYVFGGIDALGHWTDQIVEFDILLRTTVILPLPLPTPRANMAVASDGVNVYLFGGDSAGGNIDEILVFDPVYKLVTTSQAKLPMEMNGIAAVWTGTEALLFGGNLDGHTNTDIILKFQTFPVPLIVTSTETLPAPLGGAAAAWDPIRRVAFIFGGHDAQSAHTSVLQFSPAIPLVGMDTLTQRPVELPSGRYHAEAAWFLDGAYIIGGVEDDGSTSEYILKYTA